MLNGEVVAQRVRGESNLHRILAILEEQEAAGKEDLPTQLHQISRNLPRRSMVIIISDFLTPLSELEDALQHLRHHAHEVTFLQVLSERETSFDESLSAAFRDLESDEVLETNTQAIQKLYLENLQKHLAELKAM